jgi:AraC-like DNA-binding protein
MKTIFDRLLDLHAHPETMLRRTRLREAMIQLLLEVIDNSARHTAGDPGAIIREIVRSIQSRPSDDFAIKDLARKAGYSLSWFKMRFKAETGVSPRQFILRTKIEAACRRLLASDDSISQIAGDLGFPTSQYFATVFRRLMRISPRQYREEGVHLPTPSHRKEDGQV